MEMSGQRVSSIIQYSIDENKQLTLKRRIIFPQLITYIGSGESEWQKYRAYLQAEYGDDLLPTLVVGDRTFRPGPVDSVEISGLLRFYHAPVSGLSLVRTLYPSMHERLFVEMWSLTNVIDSSLTLRSVPFRLEYGQPGKEGTLRRIVTSDQVAEIVLAAGEKYHFGIHYSAVRDLESEPDSKVAEVLDLRTRFLDTIRANLILETPDPVLNTLFYFSKIRAAESIFKTRMGLVHSPGGGRYYAGVWANDQAEYSGPFFPYLGYRTGNIAALNAYRVFLNNIPEGEGHFWSSFEMNGTLTCCGADRGDAAMIAFGAAHFTLAEAEDSIARELWPLIEWCLDYCDRRKNEDGVILSDSDEMEGRIPTGGANLSTSSLYYGALLLAADLGEEMGIPREQIRNYRKEAGVMAVNMENYFGATIEDLKTYRYFKGHEYLRHWICLPLVMGITERQEGTLNALFTKLWTDNGIRVEYNPGLEEPNLFWDRGTLYAFRGAFKAGATDRSLQKLIAYSTTRLLGFHVPYVVEAWPEGNMAHLSAESALYCRIFTEGLLGINPVGFKRFEMSPKMPEKWTTYSMKNIKAFNTSLDIYLQRKGNKIQVKVLKEGETIFDKKVKQNDVVEIGL
jgi:hypothetical protein